MSSYLLWSCVQYFVIKHSRPQCLTNTYYPLEILTLGRSVQSIMTINTRILTNSIKIIVYVVCFRQPLLIGRALMNGSCLVNSQPQLVVSYNLNAQGAQSGKP